MQRRAWYLVQRAREACKQGELGGALCLFTEGLKLKVADNLLNARLHGGKGWVHMRLKQYALAIVECSKASSLDNNLWEPHWVRHEAWWQLGVYSMALQVRLLHLPSTLIIMPYPCHGLGFRLIIMLNPYHGLGFPLHFMLMCIVWLFLWSEVMVWHAGPDAGEAEGG